MTGAHGWDRLQLFPVDRSCNTENFWRQPRGYRPSGVAAELSCLNAGEGLRNA